MFEALQRDLNQAIESVNTAVLAMQRVVSAISTIGLSHRQETEQMIATLSDVEEDLITLLDTVEELADQGGETAEERS